MNNFYSFSLLFFHCLTTVFGEETTFQLPSSCLHLDDGYHYVQPLSKPTLLALLTDRETRTDTGVPPIKVMCTNGWTIINPSLDPNVERYYSSYHDYHETFSGPSLSNHVSWEQWWLPSRYDKQLVTPQSNITTTDVAASDDTTTTSRRRRRMQDTDTDTTDTSSSSKSSNNNVLGSELEDDVVDPFADDFVLETTTTKFSLSEDCQTCLETSDLKYSDTSSYYMTGDTYGCNWYTKFICDFDVDTLECYECSSKTSGDRVYSGKCGHMELPSYITGHTNHKYCTEGNGEYLPSIGTTNKYCVCYKPVYDSYQDSTIITALSSSSHKYELADTDSMDEEMQDKIDEDIMRVVYLSQEDFVNGTYRIKRSGTYILTEDITFDFNAGDIDSPNDVNAWFPRPEQSEQYPGSADDEWDGYYWLGFFAGITIEADDVILDLNGFTIQQSHAFYLQQRVFSCVELNNKLFRDGEGPTWMGAGLSTVSNIRIQNGIIGKSSHLGIHGNTVSDLTLKDLIVKEFETHGIAINEFNNLIMDNVEVGPSINGQLGLNGLYTVARSALRIIRDASDQDGSAIIAFAARDSLTLSDLVDNLIEQMDLAFTYAYKGVSPSEDSDNYETWLKAKELFVNDIGVARAGVIYGMLLRSRGASVFGYGKDNGGHSSGLTMNDCKIHDLVLSMDELVSIGNSRHRWIKDMFNGPVPFKSATDNDLNPLSDSVYTGNAWTDIILALRLLDNSWWHLGRLTLWSEFLTWARDGTKLSEAIGEVDKNLFNHCNNDYLGHVPKGILGIRMENVQNVAINNLEIYNLFTISELGSEECGQYTGGDDGGMPLQNVATNPGYGGTNTRGIYLHTVTNANIENLYMHNVMSLNGPSYGIYLYSSPFLNLKNAVFEHIESGLQLFQEKKDFSNDHWPNMAARSCAIEYVASSVSNTSKSQVSVSCMTGHAHCACTGDELENQDAESCVGIVNECTSDATYDLPLSTVYVSSDGNVVVEEKENGGYQPKSFEEFDLKLKKIQLTNNNGNITRGSSIVIISMIGIIISFLTIYGLYYITFKHNSFSTSKIQQISQSYDYEALIQH